MQLEIKKILKLYWQGIPKIKFTITVITGILTVFLGFVMLPFLMKDFFDLISEFKGENREILLPDLKSIFIKIVILAIVAFFVFQKIADWLLRELNAISIRNLTKLCFYKIHTLGHDFFNNQFAGKLLNKSIKFSFGIISLLDSFLLQILTSVVLIISVSFILFPINSHLTLVLIIWMIVYTTFIYKFSLWHAKSRIDTSMAASTTVGKFIDTIINYFSIKIFTGNSREKKSIEKTINIEYKKRIYTLKLGFIRNCIQSILMTALEFYVIWFLMTGWVNGIFSVGEIFLIQTYFTQFYINLWGLGTVIKGIFTTLADSQEMSEIFDLVPEVLDVKNPQKCRMGNGKIEFKNVDFGYEFTDNNNQQKLLKNFNLEIEAGQKIGLVGHSGGGKTTITKLLLRLLDIQDGEILIDGQNIAKISQDDLRQNITYIPQETLLFHRTIRENILYGDENSTNKEMLKASKDSHSHEFIKNLENKYETLVGERGIKLSGGQRQRISIARAMLKKSAILILDEATSALDSESEKFIQESFIKLMKNRTTIAIAHRLSTIKQMDKIIVLDNGKILESGTHSYLIKKKGKYAKLWEHQTGNFLEE